MTDPRTLAWPTNPSAYNIVETLGTGASAEVFKAFCEPLEMYCAIKKLNVDTDSFLKEIRRELTSMSACRHDNILSYYCTFVSGTSLFIVMPLMTSSISDVLHLLYPNGFDSESVIAFILQQTLLALYHLHSNRLVHRDVKASNILVSNAGDIMLSDFGVAFTRSLNRSQNCTTFVGTPCFIAPEVIRFTSTKKADDSFENSGPVGYDDAADIWSLGVMAIEMAIGKAPASNLEPMKVLLNTVKNPAPTLQSALNASGQEHKHFTRSFHDFINKCLKKDPTQRPSAEELLEHKFIKSAKRQSHFAQHVMHVFDSNGGVRAARAAERRRREQRLRGVVAAESTNARRTEDDSGPKPLTEAVEKETAASMADGGWDFGESGSATKQITEATEISEYPTGENGLESEVSSKVVSEAAETNVHITDGSSMPCSSVTGSPKGPIGDFVAQEESKKHPDELISHDELASPEDVTSPGVSNLSWLGVCVDPKKKMQQLNSEKHLSPQECFTSFRILYQFQGELENIPTVASRDELYRMKEDYYKKHVDTLEKQTLPGRRGKPPADSTIAQYLVLFLRGSQAEGKTPVTPTPHAPLQIPSGTDLTPSRSEAQAVSKKGRFVVKKKSREPVKAKLVDAIASTGGVSFTAFAASMEREFTDFMKSQMKHDGDLRGQIEALVERIEELENENQRLKDENQQFKRQLNG